MTLFPLAFIAIQINVEYENGGFLSPFFLYCSALSKPVTRYKINIVSTESFIVKDETYSFGSGFCVEVFWDSDQLNVRVN